MSQIGENGLAQVLDWKDNKPFQNIRINQNPTTAYQDEMMRRRAKDQAYEKAKKSAEINTGGVKHYLPDITKGVNELNTNLDDQLNSSNNERDINQIIHEYRPNINREKQNLANAVKAEAAYTDLTKDIDREKYVHKDFANALVHDYLLKDPDPETGRVDYSKIDFNAPYNWRNHPGSHDFVTETNDLAKNFRNALSTSEYTGSVPGINQMFWQKQGEKYRFPVDDKGNLKKEFVDFFIKQDESNFDSALWRKIANENGLNPTHDRNKIDELFMEEKSKFVKVLPDGRENPAYDPLAYEKDYQAVYKTFENILNQHQQHQEIENRQSQGRNPSGSGYSNNVTPKLSEGEAVNLAKSYDEVPVAGPNKGIIAVKGKGMDLQNYLKNSDEKLTLSGKTGVLLGLGIDPKTGERSIQLRSDNKYGDQVVYAPFNDYNENAIVKYLNDDGAKAVDLWKKEPILKFVRDDEKIKQVGGEIQSIVKNDADDESSAEAIQSYLNDTIGLDVKEVKVDHSNFPWTNHDVTVDGEKFPMTKEGVEKMQKTLFNKDMMKFGKEQGKETESQNPTKHIIKGKEYSNEQVEKAAKASGMSIEEYLKAVNE